MSLPLSLKPVLQVLAEPEIRGIARHLRNEILSLSLFERWVPRSKYAKHYGVHCMTIYRRTPFLRRLGAVTGKGKMTRYDITVAPSGERLSRT